MFENKRAKALVANVTMEEIILERYLSNTIPISNKFSIKKLYKFTGHNYYRLRNYIESNLYTISKYTITITDNTQLLADQSKEYVERLIKKTIYLAKNINKKIVYFIAQLFDYSLFTKEEQKFIELMANELFLITESNEISRRISYKDLNGFLELNHGSFLRTVRQVYNDILQRKIRAGDNIMKYLKECLTEIEVAEKLEKSCKYDYFFDSNGCLKCDLVTNINILIKNFLSTIISGLTDDSAKIILLLKLNKKYPLLICEKVFDEYD